MHNGSRYTHDMATTTEGSKCTMVEKCAPSSNLRHPCSVFQISCRNRGCARLSPWISRQEPSWPSSKRVPAKKPKPKDKLFESKGELSSLLPNLFDICEQVIVMSVGKD